MIRQALDCILLYIFRINGGFYMKLNSFFKSALATCAILAAVGSVQAGWFDFFSSSSDKEENVSVLVVTGNYAHPRLLAEVVQKSTKQPYLIIIPGRDDEAARIFFCRPEPEPAVQISERQLRSFIEFLNPGMVVVLGDSSYVPDLYVQMVEVEGRTIVVVDNNWDAAAFKLKELTGGKNIIHNYRNLSKSLPPPSAPTAPVKKKEDESLPLPIPPPMIYNMTTDSGAPVDSFMFSEPVLMASPIKNTSKY